MNTHLPLINLIAIILNCALITLTAIAAVFEKKPDTQEIILATRLTTRINSKVSSLFVWIFKKHGGASKIIFAGVSVAIFMLNLAIQTQSSIESNRRQKELIDSLNITSYKQDSTIARLDSLVKRTLHIDTMESHLADILNKTSIEVSNQKFTFTNLQLEFECILQLSIPHNAQYNKNIDNYRKLFTTSGIIYPHSSTETGIVIHSKSTGDYHFDIPEYSLRQLSDSVSAIQLHAISIILNDTFEITNFAYELQNRENDFRLRPRAYLEIANDRVVPMYRYDYWGDLTIKKSIDVDKRDDIRILQGLIGKTIVVGMYNFLNPDYKSAALRPWQDQTISFFEFGAKKWNSIKVSFIEKNIKGTRLYYHTFTKNDFQSIIR